MSLIELNEQNFEELVKSDGILFVDCWANYCNACKDFAPVFEEVSKQNPKHVFASLDAVAQNDLVKKLGVTHIPTLLLYREGLLLFRQPGYVDHEKLQDIVRQAEQLDMDMVREEMKENS